jgi:TonB-dependent SusC/RagA subfamily outer membrane receptor
MTYNISKSSDNNTAVDDDINGTRDLGAVTIVGADKISTKVNQVYVTASPKTILKLNSDAAPQVKLNYATTIPKTGIKLNSDVAPEAVTINKVMTTDNKPAKVYVRGFSTNNDQLTIDGEGHPLFVIDGKEVKSVNNLNPNDIKSITVLKDGTAEKKYGEKGKNGVIEIRTKKGK